MALKRLIKKCIISTLVATQVFTLLPASCPEIPQITESVYGESLRDPSQYGKKMYDFKDEEDLKYKIFSDPEFVKSYASLAHHLGYGWCGGTKTPYIGDDFSVYKEGDNYILKSNYNKNDPYASGYWADKRLKMKVSNIRFYMAPDTLETGKAKITDTKELIAAESNLINESFNTEDTAEASVTYQITSTGSHSSTYKFSEGLGLKESIKKTVKVPLAGSVESLTELSFSFNTEQGWTNTETTASSIGLGTKYTSKIPPRTKRHLQLIALKNKSDIPYTANIFVEYTLTFSGFLRYSGNAHVDHPKNRPFIDYTFGKMNGNKMEKSAAEDIADQFSHKNVPGYSPWDWNSISSGDMTWYMKNAAMMRGGNFSGTFHFDNASTINIVAGGTEPLRSVKATAKNDGKRDGNTHLTDYKDYNIGNVKILDMSVKIVSSNPVDPVDPVIDPPVVKKVLIKNERSNMALDVLNSSKESGANIQQGPIKYSGTQRWEKQENEDGTISLINDHSGMALDVKGASKEIETNVQQWEPNGTGAQKWIIKDNNDGTIALINKNSGMALDVSGSSKEAGGNVQQYKPNGTGAQRWIINDNKDGTIALVNENSNMPLDISNGSKKSGANVQQWSPKSDNGQMWKLTDNRDGTFTLINAHSGMALDVKGASKEIEANVQQWEPNGTGAQKWKLTDNKDGTFALINEISSLALDVSGGSKEAGANVKQYTPNGSGAQRWIIINIPDSN